MSRRRLAPVAAVLAATALLAGCAEEVAPTFSPEPPPEFAPPAVSEDRSREILDAVEEAVATADASGDVEAMRPRVTAPAIDFRSTQYALQGATGGAQVPAGLTTDSDVFVVTATDSWPRSLLAVSTPTADSTVRLYLGLVQDGPRDPYRLVSWSRLLPGVETPVFASSEIGSAPISEETEGLQVAPDEALARLADVMTYSPSQFADEFADDPYRQQFLATELDGLRQGVEVAGEVSTASTAGPAVFGISTADGGAVVMGTIDTTVTLRKTIPDATLTLAGEMAALGGAEEVEAAATATYKQMVTLFIPPADAADQKIQLLGAERVIASVERTE